MLLVAHTPRTAPNDVAGFVDKHQIREVFHYEITHYRAMFPPSATEDNIVINALPIKNGQQVGSLLFQISNLAGDTDHFQTISAEIPLQTDQIRNALDTGTTIVTPEIEQHQTPAPIPLIFPGF